MTTTDPRRHIAALREGLIAVPALQPGVCPVCRTAVATGFDDCRLCRDNLDIEVLPISLSEHMGLLHHHLRHYKDHTNPMVRRQLAVRLAALLAVFLRNHLACLGGQVDLVATVPSPVRDAAWELVTYLRQFNGMQNPLEFPSGDAAPVIRFDVADKHVLLLDDTFTTGSSIFKATRVLQAAGAHVVGPLVIGRHMRPDYPPSARMLDALARQGHAWAEDRCAWCYGAVLDPPLRSPTALF